MKEVKVVMVMKVAADIALLGDNDGQRVGCRQRRQMRMEDGRK
jgi:hypothetical protein